MIKEETKARILLVSISDLYGGAETYLVKLAALLLRRYEVAVIVNNKTLDDDFQRLNINVWDIRERAGGFGGRYVAATSAIRSAVRSFRPDVVHLNGQAEAYLALPMTGWAPPIVITRHTPLDDLYLEAGSRVPVWLKRSLVVRSHRKARQVVCVSRLLRGQMAPYIPEERLSFIPTWLQVDVVERPREFRTTPTPLKLLFVGRVVKVKGIFDLIEAVRVTSGVSLDVVGEGEDMEAAQQAADGLPIHFHGFQNNCRPFYERADLLVFASHEGYEGLPQVPLEAMDAGLPCLGSDISAMREIVSDERAAELYKAGNIADLACQLSRLQRDPDRLNELSAAGRERVVALFTEKAVSEAYYAVFDEARKTSSWKFRG